MHHLRRYQIEVEDEVDVEAFNTLSPLEVAAAGRHTAATVLQVDADQSGLVGLLSHLHQQGYLILDVSIKEHANGK